MRVLGRFLSDFRPGVHYDEFKWYDWKPGLVEGAALAAMLLGWIAGAIRRAAGYLLPAAGRRHSVFTNSTTQRSIRA